MHKYLFVCLQEDKNVIKIWDVCVEVITMGVFFLRLLAETVKKCIEIIA